VATKSMKEFTSPQYRLQVVKDFAVLWKNLFQFFAEKEPERKFTAQEEQAFEDTIQNITVNLFRFHEAVVPFMKNPTESVLKVLGDTPSLAAVHSMSDATFSKTQVDWHALFIEMNKALGKLTLIQPKPRK